MWEELNNIGLSSSCFLNPFSCSLICHFIGEIDIYDRLMCKVPAVVGQDVP